MSLLAGLRQQAGMTQEQLAYRAKVSRATVQRIERGCDCDPDTAKRLAKVLGVKWTVFFDQPAQKGKRPA